MPIQLTDLTNGSTKREVGTQPVWEGTAIFDVLMKAVNENINIQFEQNRITGSDYATVYLGAIETCIKEATNLLLQKAIADKEIEVKQAQILNIQEDTKLKTAQIATEQEETKLKTEGIKLAIEETKLKAAQAVAFPLQSAKDLELKQAQINVAVEEKRLKAAQADAYPLQASKDALLKQVQVDLYERQIEGFDDNKRQKLFDSSVNGWALAYSSGILDKATIPTFINDASMTQLFNTIKG